MLLTKSISDTKRFFHETLHKLKSLFSTRYHKLPKTPPYNLYHSSMDMNSEKYYKDLDSLYTDFNTLWESNTYKEKSKKRRDINTKKKITVTSSAKASTPPNPNKEASEGMNGDFNANPEQKAKHEEIGDAEKQATREKRVLKMEKKLREIEKMDMKNLDHVLDIQEVLYYYSLLNCSSYVHIVDKFFIDIYNEFLECQLQSTMS